MRLTGFEPATFRVGAEHSIQLSYRRISMKTAFWTGSSYEILVVK